MRPFPKIETVFARGDDHKVRVEQIKSPAIRNIKLWDATEKLDGTNIRIAFHAAVVGALVGPAFVQIGGRTDNAQLHVDLLDNIREWATVQAFEDAFVATQYLAPGDVVTLYGEGVGPGIQKVGGMYGDYKHFVLFDVKYGDGLTGWLDDDTVDEVAKALGAIRCPRITTLGSALSGAVSLDDAVDAVRGGFPSVYGGCQAEGLVLRPHAEPLYDRRGKRIIAKIKTCDF